MRININKEYKSIKAPQEFELPDFVVLTGKNGSGKSHLMEVMSKWEFCTVNDNDRQLGKIKYIGFNGLNPQVNSDGDYLDITNRRKEAWNQLKNQIEELHAHYGDNVEIYINSHKSRKNILGYWINRAKGNIENLTEEFVYDNYEVSSDEIFSSQFASIFKLYQIRYDENGYFQYKNDKEGEHNKVLSDEEFKTLYGPKPWDLINDMLEFAQLPYRVNHPTGHRETSFHLCLTDVNTGIQIQVNDLSTGEKVLMSLALSIYNSNEENARPDVLLLDEPDAPLHPEFSKVFISAVENSIVKEAGVKVIISTHSPTTVAIAPEESLYRMNKQTSRPEKITKQQAVNILVQDLDNIRLSFENRRQVFVESEYDVQYYSRLFNFISQKYPMPTLPQFLPPKRSKGSNCDEVSEIVNTLRGFGNDLVYGIKDYDNKNYSSQYVLVLGEGKRYAIDNYILDPIYVAFLLIRENIIKTEDAELPHFTYVELTKLSDDQVQFLIKYVIDALGLASTDEIGYITQGGKSYKITQDYCFIQGHALESNIINRWPQLNAIAKGGGDNKLKNYILDTVCKDYPDFISTDFIELFNKIV